MDVPENFPSRTGRGNIHVRAAPSEASYTTGPCTVAPTGTLIKHIPVQRPVLNGLEQVGGLDSVGVG
jgi:hypothetical protein